MANFRFLLLQIRDVDDPMRMQEISCFANSLNCPQESIQPMNLLEKQLTTEHLGQCDMVLIGGSGNYSAAADNPWLEKTLTGLRVLLELRKPTFASCWGFQALARAMGGRCIHDPAHAELGTIELTLTEAGKQDPVFAELGSPFLAQAGHEDHVVELPPGAVLLASSSTVSHQAFKFTDAPIYCTQFHPELDLASFFERVTSYPQYIQQIAGIPMEEFTAQCQDTPATRQLLRRFVDAMQLQLEI